MPILLPYRVKNPVDRIPFVTLSLIAINILIFVLTVQTTPGDGFLSVRRDCALAFGVSHNTMSLWRLFTSMFMHGSILHIAGNMWFLWLFGASLEARMGPLKFLALYIISGLFGGICEDAMEGFFNPNVMNIGASGAIMGLVGAYLYVFPHAPFRIFWFTWVRGPRLLEWKAWCVVLYYIAFDLIEAQASRWLAGYGIAPSVAQFAHLGGAFAGFLFVVIARVRRDSEDVSEAQAIRADARDFDLLTVYELEALMQYPTNDMRLVIAYCEKVLLAPGSLGEQKCAQMLQYYAAPLIEVADQRRLAGLVLRLPLDYGRTLPSVMFLRLGTNMEQQLNYDMAVRVYRRVWELYPRHADAEVALFRAAGLMNHCFHNTDSARYFYSELIRTFPSGRMADDARAAIAALPYVEPPFR
jgi:membrane associated rhomboid family serine protease